MILAKVALPMDWVVQEFWPPLPKPICGRLKRLKNSVRNEIFSPSRKGNGNERATLRSVFSKLGLRSMLRPSVPNVPGAA